VNIQNFVLGVDLDGTCADFCSGLRPIAAEWLNVPLESLTENPSHGLSEWHINDAPGGYEDLHKFAVTQRELFKVLEPYDGAPLELRKLSKAGVRIRIITHRLYIKHFHQTAVQQTIEWLDYHDIPYWDLCFMKDKAAVGADLYVEDSPDNILALRADSHPTIVFVNPSNRHLDPPKARNWQEVSDLVMTHVAQWKTSRQKMAQQP
jgi:hypothetical protein